MVNLTIDDKQVKIEEGATILDAARKAGVEIPTLCDHADLSPYGACRMCLVEVSTAPGRLMTACSTPVVNDMKVSTRTPAVMKARKTVLELLLVDHPLDCIVCDKCGECELQNLAYEYEVNDQRFKGRKLNRPHENRSPVVQMNPDRCVLCGRCVRVCADIVGADAIDFVKRGSDSRISTPYDRPLDCEHCGQCIEVCPVGALTNRQFTDTARSWEMEETETTCPYCGTGCTMTLQTRNGQVKRVVAKSGRGVNRGALCTKGRFGYMFVNSPDRLKTPLIKKDGQFVEASWSEALSLVAAKFEQYKGDSFGAFSSSRCTNEDNYLFQKFVRGVMGTNNVDTCARI
jgi:NADH-quinone oxidoreductase subunit G